MGGISLLYSMVWKVMEALIGRMGFSARAYSRILKVARTIADLAGCDSIRPEHLQEAAALRVLDRVQSGF